MASKDQQNPLCACGCGKRTGGGTFRPGHDQRLRGTLSRGEPVQAATRAFLSKLPKSSEFRKLQERGRSAGKEARREVQKAAKPRKVSRPKSKPAAEVTPAQAQ